ncbi:MAG: UspA protein [Firmicutes bacterium]|nr:UspA protein [Bacillota bacterium]
MGKKILVALDNSDYADKVMLEAVQLAKAYKASLIGVSVIENAYTEGCDQCKPWVNETKDYWALSYQTVLDKCKNLFEEKGGCTEESCITFDHKMLTGSPAVEILKYAEQQGVDIIVLGHLGKTAASGFLIGSVAQKVAAYSKCSVFIVK